MKRERNVNSKPSYRKSSTWASTGEIHYQKDFKSSGSFKIERGHGNLNCFIGLGMYKDGKWSIAKTDTHLAYIVQTDEVEAKKYSYQLMLHYHHKRNVEVEFFAFPDTIKDKDAQDTHDFIEQVAKKFFFLSKLLTEEVKWWWEWPDEDTDPTWDDVKKLIDGAKKRRNPYKCSLGASWTKIMTVKQAENLMSYLGIKVKFPH